jgi:hypothetical protein
MKFAIFKEINREGRSSTYYLQFDGNEGNLFILYNLIKEADFTHLIGEYSTYELDITDLKSEDEIEENNTNVCRGYFNFPWETSDIFNEAVYIDDLFYGGKIKHYFDNILYN